MVAFSTRRSPETEALRRRRGWPERSVAFRGWKSATDSNRRRAFQGWKGVHLILANPPWRQLRERAQKIQGDKKHVQGFSRRVLT
jgi:hypothetical protein